MELALLVWGVSVISGISVLITVSAIVLAIFTLFATINILDRGHSPKMWKWALPLILSLSLIAIVIPSEKTAYVMIGAYATQKIATDPKAEQIGAKVLTIINKELDSIIAKK